MRRAGGRFRCTRYCARPPARARGGIGRGEAAVAIADRLLGLVLEGVRIDRVEAESERGRFLAQRGVVTDLVPREMGRDPRGSARELVDDCAVGELLVDVGWLARDREFGETRAPASRAPGRDGDGKGADLGLDRVDVDSAPRQLALERAIILGEGFGLGGIALGDLVLRQGQFELLNPSA